jgi:hypothetical protein
VYAWLTPWNIGALTLREWDEIAADLWRMEKQAAGHGTAGGANEMIAFAESVNSPAGVSE